MESSVNQNNQNTLNELEYNFITKEIIGCAMEVHKELGPGLLESVYEYCLIKLLEEKNLKVESQVKLPIYFKGEKLDKFFMIDLLVCDRVIIEIKSVDKVLPVHEAQLVTYIKLSGKKLGLLINFNEKYVKDGIRRRIYGDLEN